MIISCNVLKLTNEFQDKGIIPHPIFDNEDGTGDFTFAEGTDMELVQQIIDAHDPTPLPLQPTQDDYLLDLDFRLSIIELGV